MTRRVHQAAGILPLEPLESRLDRFLARAPGPTVDCQPSQVYSGLYQYERPRGLRSFGQAVCRARARARLRGGYTWNGADLICVRVLGLHPAEVYGSLWWEGGGDSEEVRAG